MTQPRGSRASTDSDDAGWLDHASGSDDEGAVRREARSREQRYWNEGFREGVEAGKEETLQHGFNVGFREGSDAGLLWGELRGVAAGMAALGSRLKVNVDGSSPSHALQAPSAELARDLLIEVSARAPTLDGCRAAAARLEGAAVGTPSEVLAAFAHLMASSPTETKREGDGDPVTEGLTGLSLSGRGSADAAAASACCASGGKGEGCGSGAGGDAPKKECCGGSGCGEGRGSVAGLPSARLAALKAEADARVGLL